MSFASEITECFRQQDKECPSEQICKEVDGSYKCDCQQGYAITSGGKCEDNNLRSTLIT